MSISTSLQLQITAIQSRINSVAASATPEDVVLLAKAVEAIAGRVSALDLREYTDTLGAELTATATTASNNIAASVATGDTQITTAKNNAIAAINANSFTRAEFHSTALLF